MKTKTKIEFYDDVDDILLQFAVIVAKSFGTWVFCKHKERDTYEIPGGHREVNEDILKTAMRELYEETGAIDYDIRKICPYSVEGVDGLKTYGMLYYADIVEFEDELHSEMEKIYFFEELPKENWTYPLIQPKLVEKFLENAIESLVATKAVVEKDGKILLLLKGNENNSEDGIFGAWDLPGGRITQFESPIIGLQREIKEETSLLIDEFQEIGKTFYELRDGRVLKFIYYRCTTDEESIKLSVEHKKYYWKNIEEIMNNELIPEWIKEVVKLEL